MVKAAAEKVWRDNDGKRNTIKVMAEERLEQRSDGKQRAGVSG
jgi:hypothetical protein